MNRSEQKKKNQRRRAILDALEEQLASPETPEVQQHYDRLLDLGTPDLKARLMMARVFTGYIWHTLRKDAYTYQDYVADLAKLPETDWLDREEADEGEGAGGY